jgi:hypothetical protein
MWPFIKKRKHDMDNLEVVSEPGINYDVFYSMRFKEIPEELFPKIKQIFDDNLTLTFVNQCHNMIQHDGMNNWMLDYHFSTGMKIRNLLRDNGILDSMFSTENLDDYYISMLEWWLGYR